MNYNFISIVDPIILSIPIVEDNEPLNYRYGNQGCRLDARYRWFYFQN